MQNFLVNKMIFNKKTEMKDGLQEYLAQRKKQRFVFKSHKFLDFSNVPTLNKD